MTKELFEKAKFGDRFVTRDGQEALFLRLTENSEWQFADFYVKDWGLIRVNRESGKCLNNSDTGTDIVGMEPSLPSDLDKAAIQAHTRLEDGEGLSFLNIFKAGQGVKIGETKVYIEADLEGPPYSQLWLNLEGTEFQISDGVFKTGDEVEVILRKIQ